MKQKTAMQILLDSINKELQSDAMYSLVYSEALEDVRDYILENFLLEKEKEQIMWAFHYNVDSMYDDTTADELAEEYYNSTYKQD